MFVCVSACVCSVPASVTQLNVSNEGTTDSLRVRWTKAEGDVDLYRMLLIQNSIVIRNESVTSQQTSHSFHMLRSGTPYKVVVISMKNGVSSKQRVSEGCTGNSLQREQYTTLSQTTVLVSAIQKTL